VRTISHRRAGASPWGWFAEYAGALPSVRLEMGKALRQLLRAPDSLAVCNTLMRHPILLLESAPELLRATAAEAERRGDQKDEEILMSYLSVLELARKRGIAALIRDLKQEE
jgi:hypothetical protein